MICNLLCSQPTLKLLSVRSDETTKHKKTARRKPVVIVPKRDMSIETVTKDCDDLSVKSDCSNESDYESDENEENTAINNATNR